MRARVVVLVVLLANLLPVGLAHISEAAQEPQAPRTLADYDGDGYGDLAIGVPTEGITQDGQGAVSVLYGTATGLSATARPDQLWHQDSLDVDGTAEMFDRFGSALAAADFNGDGFSDLAVGVPSEDIDTKDDAGAVNVIYGSPNGLSATFVPDQLWSQDATRVEGVADSFEYFGDELSAADFNGDGFADLAIGVPTDHVGSIIAAGAVNVIYGSAAGLAASGGPILDQLWTQNSPDVAETAATSDRFGDALAAGDLDADGTDDLVVGVPYEDTSAGDGVGGVNVLYGSATGINPSGTPDQFWTQDSPDVEGTAEEGDTFGARVAVGQFGREAGADLAIGAPFEDIGTISGAGSVNVLYGSPGIGVTAGSDQLFSQDDPDIAGVPEEGDAFGSALAAANFGRGEQDDLVIGAGGQRVGNAASAGVAHVIYGTALGLSASATPAQLWSQNAENVEDTAEPNDYFGASFAAANLGGSPEADLAVGAYGENVGAGTQAGGVNVLYGTPNGLSAVATPDQFWSQDSLDVNDKAESFESFGFVLAAA